MEAVEVTSKRSAGVADAAPLRRFVVIVGQPADVGSAMRIQEPDRLLRIWSLLQATREQLDSATLPPEGIPRLQRQFQTIRRELDGALSPPLVAELRRIVPSPDATPSAGALRIECAALVSWTASLVVQMLTALAAAQEQLQHVSTSHGQR
jgi:Protein of unknown function (DUF2587)